MTYAAVLLCVSYTTRFAYLPRAVVDMVDLTSGVVRLSCPSTSSVAVAVDGIEQASV